MLRQCLVPILATIGIGLLVLSAARFLIIFDLVLGNDQGLLIVARMLGAFIPHYLAFMLPLSLYWGSYLAARQLTVGSELNILQATGSSIARSFGSLIVLGVVFSCLAVFVVGWMQPVGRYSYRALIHTIQKSDFYLRVRESTFMNINNRTIYVQEINQDRHSFRKIMIYEPLADGGSTSIYAPRGNISKLDDRLNLRLYDGQRVVMPASNDPDNVQTMNFGMLDIPLGNVAVEFRPRGEDEQELLLPELITQNVPIGDADMVDLSMALHKRLVIALSCLFLPMLAIVLGVQSSRKKNLYQSIIALLIIIIYHQLIEFMGDYGKRSELGPAVTLWSLYGVFFGTSLLLFYKTSTGIGPISDRIASRIDRIGMRLDPSTWLRSRPQAP